MSFTKSNIYKYPPKQSTISSSSKLCPYCHNDKIYLIRRNMNKCSKCRREWSPRKGTILEHSKLSFDNYNKINDLITKELSVSKITKKLKCNYYAVYKLYYQINKEKVPQNKYLLYTLKSKTEETNFSLAQNTGISKSTIARIISRKRNYKTSKKSYFTLYEYLTNDTKSVKTTLLTKTTDDFTSNKQNINISSLFKINRQLTYAIDVLILANCIGNNAFTKHIPEKFFYDYLYKTQVTTTTMNKVLAQLKRNNLIQSLHGYILKTSLSMTYFSEKKEIRLITSLAMYYDKTNDYSSSFGWILLTNNKKLTDECFIKALIQNENLTDTEKRSFLIELYEKKHKRTNSFVYASILYHKIMISELSLGNMTKQLHDIKKYFSTVGVLREKSSKELLQKLGYETHMVFFSLYKNFQFLDCSHFTLRTKKYYREKIDSTTHDFLIYHLLVPNYHLIEKNSFGVLERQMLDLKNIRNIEQTPIYFQNAMYFFYLFYAIVRKNNPMLKKYYKLLDKNEDKYIVPNDLLNRYESLALLFANRKKYIYSLVFLLQWIGEISENRFRKFVILIYLRIILQKIKGHIIDEIEAFFLKKKPKKKYLRIELTKDNTVSGLMQLLSLCRVKSPGLSFNASDLIRWMDNYMIAFRQAVYTKRMLLSSTGRFIRKIRRMDISIENTSDEEFLQVFKSMLSFTPKYKDRILPAVTSENILLLHSTYYCLYEYLFLKEKTVSKIYTPIVPLYMQRLIEK